MARQKARLVQGRLFEAPEVVAGAAGQRAGVRRAVGTRVTRDPAVAQAHEEAHRLSQSVKLGLARILASRAPEERAALRSLLAKSHVA